MPEWLIGAVSKTVVGFFPTVGSNPTPSACTNARPAEMLAVCILSAGAFLHDAPFPVDWIALSAWRGPRDHDRMGEPHGSRRRQQNCTNSC